MSNQSARTLSACCTAKGAVLQISFPASVLTDELKSTLEKRLLKKGVGLRWVDETGAPQLMIRLVHVDAGNQFLRWLLPFVAPAVLEVEGQVAGAGSRPFHYTQKAQVGLFGGSPTYMLKTCAARVGDKIAGDVLGALGA